MKIAMFAEGSYPYVAGGVSGWMQMLMREMDEMDFIIYTLLPDKTDGGKFKYDIPSNVCEIRESYLLEKEQSRYKVKKIKLSEEEKEGFRSLLLGENVRWDTLFDFFEYRNVSVSSLLMSRDFLELVEELYAARYSNSVFSDFLWSIRSLYLPLFRVLQIPIGEADCYHAISTGYAGIMACKAKHFHNKPLILTEHGIYTREREEEIVKADWTQGIFKNLWIQYFYALSQCIYDAADEVVSLFQAARMMQLESGCPKDKTRVIANGVFFKELQNLPGKEAGEEEWINIGAVLRIVPIKDVKTMIHAYALAKEKIPALRLYLMGPTEENEKYYEECLELVESFHIPDVIFTGRIQVKKYLGKMDMIILTSISEGQPLCLLEAMAAGKPCIATDVGGCKELLYGADNDYIGKCGLVIPTMNVDKAAEAISELALSRELREELGENGRTRAMEFYRNEDVIKNYRRLYDEVMERGWKDGWDWI